jgi:predicted dehydrogenase
MTGTPVSCRSRLPSWNVLKVFYKEKQEAFLPSQDKIRWGILSTGNIARTFASELSQSKTGLLEAVGSRTLASAISFARRFRIKKAYGTYEELLKDPAVEAVYIATPHPLHARWALAAAQAKKHILCEKPLAMNASEAQKMIRAAKANRVFLMEAFMYRCHPQTEKVIRMIKEGVIGKVRMIQASFCLNRPFDPKHRLFNKALGGGGILDIGLYPVSFSRLVAGAACGKPYAEPMEIKGAGHIGKTGVDEWAVGILKFPGDIFAEVRCATRVEGETAARVYGTKGCLTLLAPWHPNSRILLQKGWRNKPREIRVKNDKGVYAWEADKAGAAIRGGQRECSAMSWRDSLGNMRALDRWIRLIRK